VKANFDRSIDGATRQLPSTKSWLRKSPRYNVKAHQDKTLPILLRRIADPGKRANITHQGENVHWKKPILLTCPARPAAAQVFGIT
jgi:hypothetical protein